MAKPSGKTIYRPGTAARQRALTDQYEHYLVTVVTANFSSPTLKNFEQSIETLSREIGNLHDKLERTQQMLETTQTLLLEECEEILKEEGVIAAY